MPGRVLGIVRASPAHTLGKCFGAGLYAALMRKEAGGGDRPTFPPWRSSSVATRSTLAAGISILCRTDCLGSIEAAWILN